MLKPLLRRMMRRAGLQRIVHRPSLHTFLRDHHVTLVVDVGANTGQFGQDVRRGGYAGKILSFEPIRSVFETLQEVSAADPLWLSANSAVGAQAGEATINVAELTVYSSIKPISVAGTAFDSRAATSRTETVPVATLTDVLQEHLPSSVFIKIDTQGFEREVLQGAVGILDHCVGLQLELPVEHLYENVWSFSEAISYLENLGFVPAQFEMVNTLRHDPSSGVEFDCIFRRKT